MRFAQFRQFNDHLKGTTGVYERESILLDLFKQCDDHDERAIAAYLLTGKIGSVKEDLTTGIKEAFIAKDLGLEGRQSLEDIAKVAVERGEAGEANPSLTQVWDDLRAYALVPDRSNAAKSAAVNRFLFGYAKSKDDIPLLLQILAQKVNNGIQDVSLLYAWYGVKNRGDRERWSRAFSLRPDIGFWVTNSLQPESVQAEPGIPLEPQLCGRVDRIEQVLEEHGGSTLAQVKLDGQRIHIHMWKQGGIRQVRLFSRALKDVTEDYPEVIGAVTSIPFESRVILDGELVAIAADNSVLPFAELQKRFGRKTKRDLVNVGVILYDVLLWDDVPVANWEYGLRHNYLMAQFKDPSTGTIRVLDAVMVTDPEKLREYLFALYEDGMEGLVCKDPASLPAPGARTKAWVKLKPDYMEDAAFGDTYDLVVIGYTKGRGKRHGRIGALWVAIRDVNGFIPVCKVGTGLSDEDVDWFTANLKRIEAPRLPHDFDEIDIFVEPEHVIEVRAARRTKIDRWAGFSLLFPRFVRRREDKTPTQATTTAEIADVVAGVQKTETASVGGFGQVAKGGESA